MLRRLLSTCDYLLKKYPTSYEEDVDMLASPGAQVPEVMQILVLFVATQQGNGTFRCLMNVAFEEEVVISMCVSYSWGTLFTVFIDSVAGNTVGKKASN